MANTEATTPRREGRSGSSWISMVVALVAVAGLLAWLATRQPPETVAVDESGTEALQPAEPDMPATVINAADLSGTAAREYVGQDVELSAVPVTAHLGSQLFWIELEGGAPYLVRLAAGNLPATGGEARIIGRVTEKTDAVLDEWESAGVLESADHRLQAEYGGTYIEARRVGPAEN
jgi:hypothetical protein